jgi:hypothetical protein
MTLILKFFLLLPILPSGSIHFLKRLSQKCWRIRDPSLKANWIRELLLLMRMNQDLFLTIRVHFREFLKKWEGVKSEHFIMLEKELILFQRLFRPIGQQTHYRYMILPRKQIFFLNAWSSVSKEMTLLGIPVLLPWPNLALYPADLNY